MKKTGNRRGFRGFILLLAAMILATSLPIIALADGTFEGDITVTNVAAGYEYKVYEILDTVGAGGEDSIFMATESWKDFLETNENAMAMLMPNDNDAYKMDAESKLYTVNMESDKAVRQAFAEDVLKYAEENGIEATESRTAEEGDREVSFTRLMLGIYVIDTAGKARVTVMWDMDWQSEIKESYKPETEEKTEIQEEAASSVEEGSTDENVAADAENTETERVGESVETPLPVVEEAPKENSNAPVIIVATIAVLAVASGGLFMKKKR